MQTYTLPRDGQRPVRFTGELVAESSGRWHAGRDQNRWHDLALYQLENRTWILSVQYRSQWQGESHHDKISTHATMDEAIAQLENHDPTVWLIGYKALVERYGDRPEDHGQYRSRQAELERSLTERYAAQVAEICAAVDIVEEL